MSDLKYNQKFQIFPVPFLLEHQLQFNKITVRYFYVLGIDHFAPWPQAVAIPSHPVSTASDLDVVQRILSPSLPTAPASAPRLQQHHGYFCPADHTRNGRLGRAPPRTADQILSCVSSGYSCCSVF